MTLIRASTSFLAAAGIFLPPYKISKREPRAGKAKKEKKEKVNALKAKASRWKQ